jgi:hypothetical protein
MKHYTSILFLSAAALFGACTEDVDVAGGAHDAHLIIIAMFNNEPSMQTVTISKSVGYFGAEDPTPVTDAKVRLSDGNTLIELINNGNGTYTTPPDFSVKPATSYLMHVHWGGSDYFAEDKAPSGIKILTAPFAPVITPMNNTEGDTSIYRPVFMFSAAIRRENTDDIYLRVTHRLNGKRILEKMSSYTVGETPAGSVYGINPTIAPMLTSVSRGFFHTEDRPDDTIYYAPFDTVGIQMHTVSPVLFRYLASLKHEAYGTANPMFGGAPANLESNWVGELPVQGIFGLYTSGNVADVVLPMNATTIINEPSEYSRLHEWYDLADSAHNRLSIWSDSIAVRITDTSEQPTLYFRNIEIDPRIKGFRATSPEGHPMKFIMKSYQEFWQLPSRNNGDTIKWVLPVRKREESRMSVLQILS